MDCPLACVANVSVWFQSKERQRNGISVLAAREMKQEPKKERGERGTGRGRKRASKRFLPFFPTPSPLFYLRNFSRGLWLSFLVLCFETATETLATQVPVVERWSLWRGARQWRLDGNFMMADSSQGNFVLTSLLTSRIWLDVTGFPESSWAPSATITMHKRRPLSLTLHAIHSRDHH